MHSMLRGMGDADHVCLRLAKAGYDGLVDMNLTADIWTSLKGRPQVSSSTRVTAKHKEVEAKVTRVWSSPTHQHTERRVLE
jgi:hypothetical protein